ncbi:CLUMA_CG001688, isoform A [Clunio marinus]|uniref:CLUMA_CG001688, isoform A n=1 Tax=Clunio marinus TaxID=568069 RepID=A0A1J1HIR5_9DIPT|nr:CLUMA_CG001688, isoform A [Clunio marinus]
MTFEEFSLKLKKRQTFSERHLGSGREKDFDSCAEVVDQKRSDKELGKEHEENLYPKGSGREKDFDSCAEVVDQVRFHGPYTLPNNQ